MGTQGRKDRMRSWAHGGNLLALAQHMKRGESACFAARNGRIGAGPKRKEGRDRVSRSFVTRKTMTECPVV